MAIDPNISLGVRPIEIANPLAQYGQVAQIQNYQNQNIAAQNQNALAQYQLGAAQRADVAAEGLNRLYAKHYDPVKGTINQNALMAEAASMPGLASQIPKLQEAATKREQEAATLTKTKTETDSAQFKLSNDKLKHGLESLTSAPTPQDAIQKLNDGVSKGFFDMKTASAEAQKLQNMTPEEYQKYRIEKILGLVDAKDKLGFMLPKTTRQDVGGQFLNIQDNPMLPGYGLPVQGMAPIAKTQTFADKTAAGNLTVNQGQLALARENAVKPVFNAEAGGFVAPPTKASPQGTFTPLPSIQQNKDQQSAIKALKSAGYDPVTGEDTISKLIAKSTSGGFATGVAGVAAFFGKSTEGRQAIAALEGTANQIATDLAGGKLGAGISNTDRDFIVAALGDVSNSMKPYGDRLAGWNAAKDRMIRVGLIPPPKPAEPVPSVVRLPAANAITNPQFPGFSISGAQ